MIHLYCLAVQAGFYSDVVECPTVDRRVSGSILGLSMRSFKIIKIIIVSCLLLILTYIRPLFEILVFEITASSGILTVTYVKHIITKFQLCERFSSGVITQFLKLS